MAESIEEVRGKERASGLMVVLVRVEEIEERGERGGELLRA